MSKFLKTILITNIIFYIALNTILADNDVNKEDDYYSSYYQDEGRIVLKSRVLGATTHSKKSSSPSSPKSTRGNISPVNEVQLFKHGLGIEGAATIFFNDNIASELSLGATVYRTKAAAINAIYHNYSNTASTNEKSKITIAFPIVLTAQYHISPFGGIRPYIGAGCHYSILYSRSKPVHLSNGYGIVGQIGIDFVMRDDTILNLDVKQYMLKTKATYKINGSNSVNSKIKMNPTVIGLGIGFKF